MDEELEKSREMLGRKIRWHKWGLTAWGSGDLNGDAVTCESTSAGIVRQSSPTNDTSCADRREAQEDRTDDVIPEAHGDAADDTTENVKDTDVREY